MLLMLLLQLRIGQFVAIVVYVVGVGLVFSNIGSNFGNGKWAFCAKIATG